MAGFLPTSWANFFTRATDYQVDFSKFGQTLTQKGLSSYSQKQLFDRAYIWAGIIIGGVSGYLLNSLRDSEAHPVTTTLALSTGVIGGFLYTRHQVTKSRIDYRSKVRADISQLKEAIMGICESYESDVDAKISMQSLIRQIEQLEARDARESVKAMQTLCLQKDILSQVYDEVKLAIEEGSLNAWLKSAETKIVNSRLVQQSPGHSIDSDDAQNLALRN